MTDLDTTPVSDLVSIVDIAHLLGVRRETVDLWRVRDRRGRTVVQPLPVPLIPNADCQSACPLWSKTQIIAWAQATGRLERSLL
jgi:hypothetical protein